MKATPQSIGGSASVCKKQPAARTGTVHLSKGLGACEGPVQGQGGDLLLFSKVSRRYCTELYIDDYGSWEWDPRGHQRQPGNTRRAEGPSIGKCVFLDWGIRLSTGNVFTRRFRGVPF